MKAAFAGGGSAGHLCPALAVAQRFLRLEEDNEVLFFGAQKDLDRRMLEGTNHKLIAGTGLPYGRSLRTLSSLLKLAQGGLQARAALKAFRPQVVLGTGGYISAAALTAADTLGLPLVIHASDACPDRTNLKLASKATRITVAFEAALEHFPADKVIVTGQPVREEILQADRETARAELGYGPEDVVLLVTGGSQGARTLNQATVGALPQLLGAGLKVFHQTGSLDYQQVKAETDAADWGPRYVCREFIHDMGSVLAAADLFLMRAGASSLAEAAAWSLPMIVVPGDFAHGHQKVNAEEVERRGAAIVVANSDLTPGRLAEVALELLQRPDRRAAMAAAARAWGTREAGDKIARVLTEVGSGTR